MYGLCGIGWTFQVQVQVSSLTSFKRAGRLWIYQLIKSVYNTDETTEKATGALFEACQLTYSM